jgi:hypothetical protein
MDHDHEVVGHAEQAALDAAVRPNLGPEALSGPAPTWLARADVLDPAMRARLGRGLQTAIGNRGMRRLARSGATVAPPDTAERLGQELSAASGAGPLRGDLARRALAWLDANELAFYADLFTRVLPRTGLFKLSDATGTAQLNHPERVRMGLAAELSKGLQSPPAFEIAHRADLGALSDREQQTLFVMLGGSGMSPVLLQVRNTAGYAGLTQAEKDRISVMIGGSTSVSTDQETSAAELLANKKANLSKPSTLRAWMKKQKYLASGVERPGGRQEWLDWSEGIKGPKDAGLVKMESGTFKALKWEASVEGRTIPIYEPVKPPKASLGVLPTVPELLDDLEHLPRSVLAQIKTIRLNPKRNPWDAYWKKEKKQKTFQSFMTSGAAGNVEIYPGSPEDAAYRDISIAHETGHVVSQRAWGDNNWGKRWAPWRKAMKDDGISVSTYAKTDAYDDFAESWALWVTTRGTPREPEVRALIPHRVALMEPLAVASENKPDSPTPKKP